jgi:hypothetical protein
MPSTYTLNNGIELISTGEQSGTWGDTTNTNLSLVDAALDGQVTVTLPSAGSSGSPNDLPISDGATSNGRNRIVIFNDGSDLGATAYVQLTPNDAEKIIYVRNSLSGSRSIILFQGTYSASNDYEVPAGTTAVVFFDGAGSGAVAANVFNNAYFDSLRLGSVSVTAILDEDNMSSNSATALATQQSIKSYVDTQVGANNELSEVLANGNTTGSNDIVVNSGQAITTNTVSETTFGSGVTIDSDVDVSGDLATDGSATLGTTSAVTGGTADGLNVVGASNGLLAKFGGNRTVYDRALQLNELSVGGVNNVGFQFNAEGTGSIAEMRFAVAGTDVVTISDDNYVGIGLTDPSTELHIKGSTPQVRLQPTADTQNSRIEFTNAAGTVESRIMSGGVNGDLIQLDGDVEVQAGHSLTLPDNVELRFGDSNDLIIEHNTSNGDIRNITNDLLIRNLADDRDVRIISDDGSGGTADYFRADGSTGEAQLFYYGAEKLNTTSGGVDITGALTLSAADPFIKLTDTSTGVDHEIDANSGVGNLVINTDINSEGSDPKLLIKVAGTTVLTARDTGDIDVNGVDIGRGGSGVASNTALGTQALTSNTTGANNSATGYRALYSNSTGNNNVANGYEALYNNTGANNVANGFQALRSNTTGTNSVANGYQALYSNTTGIQNVANGLQALYSNTTGTQNSATGYQALYSNTTGLQNSATGYQALYNNTGNNNVANGRRALYTNTTGSSNVSVGFNSLYSNTTGSNNTATGTNALFSNTTGSKNVANGLEALYSNTTGDTNVANGFQALRSNTTGSSNSATGYRALYSNTESVSNTANGYEALYSNTIGDNNVALGHQALRTNTTGDNNVALGLQALYDTTTGSDNVAVGLQALSNNTTGSGNFGAAFRTSGGSYLPVFDPTTENNRVVMGHTAVTNAYVQVAWTVVSDERDKTQIEPMQHGLDFVEQLNPVSYKFRVDRDTEETNGNKHYGFLAQDVLAIEGENNVIVDNEDPDKLRMTNEELIPVLVNAIKELKVEVETLKGKLA